MTVVALVPARDRADTVAATVAALGAIPAVDRVLVVDDGSTDDTTDRARAAGAEVLRLPVNRGKGGAVAAGMTATPDADVYLLIDADLGGTAALAERLLTPVLEGEADMTVAVLGAAGRRGGFGLVREVARSGIRRACGYATRAPLSGQRAVRAEFLRGMGTADRFGLEVGLTVDAVRAGARVLEVDLAMEHRHTGRTVRGLAHRAGQGLDVVRALWPRLTTASWRIGAVVIVTGALLALLLWSGARSIPSSVGPTRSPDRVLIVGVPGFALDDVGTGRLPTFDRLVDEGAIAAASVRTRSTRPSSTEAYATIGAGTRVEVTAAAGAEQAFPADAVIEGNSAADVVARRTGRSPRGSIVVVGGAAAIRDAGDDLSSRPGALGEALLDTGLRTAVVGSADTVDPNGTAIVRRPAAVALMDGSASISTGDVNGNELLEPDPTAPYGIRADVDAVVDRTVAALATAEVVLVDPGDTDRALSYAVVSSQTEADAARLQALQHTDALVGRLLDVVDPDTLVIVLGVTPPTREWDLTPVFATGAGVRPGYLHSPSTKRLGLVTLTDIASTILDGLGVEEPDGMIGSPLRYHPGEVELDRLTDQSDTATAREAVYFPMAVTFIVVQALVYLLATLALSQGAHRTRIAGPLRFTVLAFAAWPLATFVYRALPISADAGGAVHAVVWTITAGLALLAFRARRHPLSGFAWLAGLTAAFLVLDVATGARLQMSSILGYSPHTAARFTGLGNTAFAVLAATAVVAAAVHVQFAPRRREALVAVGAFLTVVLVADVAPTLGSDVGGVLTMVPVFGLLVLALSGRTLSWRAVAVMAGATVLVLALVTGIDLLRPAEQRTHLGRFVTDAGDGDLWTTISRKWSTNVSLFGRTIWTWMVPITSAFLVYVLVIAGGWQRLLPPRSALRAGVVATVFAGLLGWLVNDSGVVVSALVFVYVGPFLTLLALHSEMGEPLLLPPTRRAEEAAETLTGARVGAAAPLR